MTPIALFLDIIVNRSAEGDPLGRIGGIRLAGLIGGDQSRNIDQMLM